MEKLSQMPNIGPALEEQLMRVGVDTPEQLIKIGSRAAWCRIKQIDASACIHPPVVCAGGSGTGHTEKFASAGGKSVTEGVLQRK